MTSYCGAGNYPLETYATDNVIAEKDAYMSCFTQQSNKLRTEYTEAVWSKVLWCKRVFKELVLKANFIAGLP